jgi:hypothetical protein
MLFADEITFQAFIFIFDAFRLCFQTFLVYAIATLITPLLIADTPAPPFTPDTPLADIITLFIIDDADIDYCH